MEHEEESDIPLIGGNNSGEGQKTDRLAGKDRDYEVWKRLNLRENPTSTDFLNGRSMMTKKRKLTQIENVIALDILRPILKRNGTEKEADQPMEEANQGKRQIKKSDKERNQIYTSRQKKKLDDVRKVTTEKKNDFTKKLKHIRAKIDEIGQNEFQYKDQIIKIIKKLEARKAEDFDVKKECDTALVKDIYKYLGYNSLKSFGTATIRAQDALYKRMKENEGKHFDLLCTILAFIDGFLPSSADSDHRNSQQRRGQKRQSSSPQSWSPQRSEKVARS